MSEGKPEDIFFIKYDQIWLNLLFCVTYWRVSFSFVFQSHGSQLKLHSVPLIIRFWFSGTETSTCCFKKKSFFLLYSSVVAVQKMPWHNWHYAHLIKMTLVMWEVLSWLIHFHLHWNISAATRSFALKCRTDVQKLNPTDLNEWWLYL